MPRSVRERNTRLALCGLFKYCPKPVAPSSALYNPHVYKYISRKRKKKEVRSGRCGDLFPRERKEKDRRKKELHCYTSYLFIFSGAICVYVQADHSWGSMKYEIFIPSFWPVEKSIFYHFNFYRYRIMHAN